MALAHCPGECDLSCSPPHVAREMPLDKARNLFEPTVSDAGLLSNLSSGKCGQDGQWLGDSLQSGGVVTAVRVQTIKRQRNRVIAHLRQSQQRFWRCSAINRPRFVAGALLHHKDNMLLFGQSAILWVYSLQVCDSSFTRDGQPALVQKEFIILSGRSPRQTGMSAAVIAWLPFSRSSSSLLVLGATCA